MRTKRRRSASGILPERQSVIRTVRYAALFVMMMIPRTIYGFRYFPVVDDWFLYYGSSVGANHAVNLSSRPFAALADRYIFTPMAGRMMVGQLLLVLLLAAAVCLIYRAFENSRITCGAFLMLMIAMPPAGFEGIYWMSAASRIVPSVFFIALALYAQSRYISAGKTLYLIIFTAAGLFEVGFYEMLIPVYFTVTALAALSVGKKRWIIAIPAAFTIAAMVYYMVNGSDPSIADRVMLVEADGFWQHIADLFKDYRILFTEIQGQLISETVSDGLAAFAARPAYAAAALVFAGAFACVAEGTRGKSVVFDAAAGVCLILAAVSVNVIMAYIRLPFRVAYPVCIGAALIAELLLCRIRPKIVYKAVIFCIAVLCMLSSAGQVSLYRYVHNEDCEYGNMLMQDEKVTDSRYLTYIFSERKYCYNDRLQYWEYVKSAEESYASLTGMVKYQSGKKDMNNIMPVHENEMIGDYDYESDYFDLYYLNREGKLEKCTAVRVGENYDLISDNSGFIGSLTYENGEYRYNEYKGA